MLGHHESSIGVSMLTFREKRIAENFMQESENLDTPASYGWAYSALFAVGGILIVLVCLGTLNNLSAQSIKFMLLPGVTAGMLFLFAGAYGFHMSKKFEEGKLLVGVLKKLMV